VGFKYRGWIPKAFAIQKFEELPKFFDNYSPAQRHDPIDFSRIAQLFAKVRVANNRGIAVA